MKNDKIGNNSVFTAGAFGAALFGIAFGLAATAQAKTQLLNVSYDPTRELYAAYNEAFERHCILSVYHTQNLHRPIDVWP